MQSAETRLSAGEIRERFLKFFEAKGHQRLPSASLVPSDPTVLLTLAGMLPFKPIFLGQEKPRFKRVTTAQKCIRMIDVERVGQTPRHHTFFEMLGNFSFGDYFKKEAIQFAWELLTKELKVPIPRLRIAVFEKDDEAFDLWHQDIGLPKEIIFRLGEDNNFWSAGPTGPCGPCSEIYYDTGSERGCGKPDCAPGCDCDRWLEIWNLVFIQYNRNEQGELLPLKQKGIDTGMGLERIASVLQGVADNFETDLFRPLIKQVETLAKNSGPASVRIIADHSRAITQLIADGVYPSNGGRGYVLRRLIRRAVSHGRKLGIDKPFLQGLADGVIAGLGDVYPDLKTKAAVIRQTIREEEDAFLATLEAGLKWFTELAARRTIDGGAAFKLHDTYGFPIELTVELAKEQNIPVDLAGFEREMAAQRERARQTGISDKKADLAALDLAQLNQTNFSGYEKTTDEGKVQALFPAQKLVVLDKTPFYGESGGQVGDTGLLAWDKHEVRVVNTLVSPKGVVLHELENIDGLKKDQKLKATIDAAKRAAIQAHHTATHLLHKALRETLGDHVKQAGSYVGPDKLRFDFNHFHAVKAAELEQIERLVNQKIAEKLKVEVLKKSYQEAVALGAMALFGEKYGETVRVLKIGDYSLELCGGTHVKNTADIVFFKIMSESALGSGVRRLEAVAGPAAKVHIIFQAKSLRDQVEAQLSRYRALEREQEELSGQKSLGSNIFEIEFTELERLGKCVDNHDSVNVDKFLEHLRGRVDWLQERIAKAERTIAELKTKQATAAITETDEVIYLRTLSGYSMDQLRAVADKVRGWGKATAIILVSTGARPIYLITVTDQLAQAGLTAKKLAETFNAVTGGRGGGKETKAEGGGGDPAKIEAGLTAIKQALS
ncbi:MAG: alanine--tRNA ligase [Candidatus Margulisbacteria bacterium]|jgi:alanyl-tRNA synthetase|nr:alanine--tRNA ligase [Candidatus Margulisiibacteriota bacterium]